MEKKNSSKKNVVVERPVVAVGCVITHRGKILLVRSHKWHDKYVIMGGRVELGETMERAIIREAKEETGLAIKHPKFVCLAESIFDPAFFKRRHMIFVDFTAEAASTKVTLNQEAQQYVWVPRSEVLRMDLEPYSRKTIEVFLKKYA